MLGRSQEASASAIGLSVAAALILVAFVIAETMVGAPAAKDGRDTTYAMASTTALGIIVGSEGRTAAGSTAWQTQPDQITRFGLAQEDRPNFLDYAKIRSLRNGTMASMPNSYPDYPEVRAALGITDADFHLRTYPVIPGMDDPRWTKDVRGRVAYIGHIDSAQGLATLTSYANTSSASLTVSLAIRNDGLSPHIFVADVGVGAIATGAVVKTEQHRTRLLSPGEVQTITFDFPKMAYSPAVNGAKVQLSDAYGNVILNPSWISATPPSGGSNVAWAPLMSAAATYYETGETVEFQADHFEGDGTRMNNEQSARFVLVGPNGDEWVNATVGLPKNKPYTYSCPNCSAVGTYTATLWDTGVTRAARDMVHVSATALFEQNEALGAVAVKEIGILGALVANFNGQENTDANPQGDVFTDAEHIRALDDHLARYTTLVVGSEVRQNALNAGETKWAIAEWVQNGGNLVVLGTAQSQSNWLEPVYFAAQATANGGISAPDPTHPVLVSPNRLSYDRYLDRARAWDIKDDQPFTHVLTRGTNGNSVQDTLSVSNPGAYNDGTVVLTSYMPGALTSPQDDEEAKRLLHNLLSQSYTMLFLDYGPPIPSGVPVGSDTRLVAVEHPNVPGAVVEVRLVMYVFG